MPVIRQEEKGIHGSRQSIDFELFRITNILRVFVITLNNIVPHERNCRSLTNDHDLKRWALQKATEDSFLNFQASEHWLRSFKHRHHICSRKITKLVTRHQVEDSATIAISADSFLANVKQEMNQYAHEEILNTDQIGLELEMHSTRTLSHQGEKFTLARVRSKNSTTHSYTIQPMISLAGQLVGPVFLCLKELKGKMSDSKLTDYLLLLFLTNCSFFRY